MLQDMTPKKHLGLHNAVDVRERLIAYKVAHIARPQPIRLAEASQQCLRLKMHA